MNPELNKIKEVELTEKIKVILLEDLAFTYGNNTEEFHKKLKK